MNKDGGLVYQDVVRDRRLSVEAKALYAYLSSIAGVDGTCNPSMEVMKKDLRMSRNRITKYMNQLISFGVVEKHRERARVGFSTNRYKVTHQVRVLDT